MCTKPYLHQDVAGIYKATVNEPETIIGGQRVHDEPRTSGFGFPAGPHVERS
jgi:hypothetical protein